MPLNHIPQQPGPRTDDTTTPPHPPATASWRTDLARWWRRSISETGWLGSAATDVANAPYDGWYGMARWIRVALTTAGVTLALYALLRGAAALLGWIISQPGAATPELTGLIAVLTDPVRAYLAAHTIQLPVTATATYATWQAAGAGAFLASAIVRGTGARLAWLTWSGCTVAMVWAATPSPGRELAAGWALLVWAVLSIVALNGASLRAVHVTHVHNELPPQPVMLTSEPAAKHTQARATWPLN